ncbi:MAG: UPF0175 family protein [Treponema sp.]|nr:UPF0175 family protein [Treponema sp.]
MNQITVSYPETLAFSLKMQNTEFEREIKTASLVKFYEMGKISSGFAAKILGISRIDFLDHLAAYNVSAFPVEEELEKDFENA